MSDSQNSLYYGQKYLFSSEQFDLHVIYVVMALCIQRKSPLGLIHCPFTKLHLGSNLKELSSFEMSEMLIAVYFRPVCVITINVFSINP